MQQMPPPGLFYGVSSESNSYAMSFSHSAGVMIIIIVNATINRYGYSWLKLGFPSNVFTFFSRSNSALLFSTTDIDMI
jgi:hypothetical protein